MKILILFLCMPFVLFACGGAGGGTNGRSQDEGGITGEPTPPPEIQRDFKAPDLTGTGEAGVDKTWQSVTDAGVSIETFVLDFNGEERARRYLLHLPSNFDESKSYPLVIFLHGANLNAEMTRAFDTYAEFEILSDQDEFIVVYGNAYAPEPDSLDDPFDANTGIWGGDSIADLNHDLEYLETIVFDLGVKNIDVRKNEIFLGGISNGGAMTQAAIEFMPDFFRAGFSGVPPVLFPVDAPANVSMMFYYAMNDPLIITFFEGAPKTYNEYMSDVIVAWATGMGIEGNVMEESAYTPIADNIIEGENYTGDAPKALASQNSELEEVVYYSVDGLNQIHIIRSERGGHGHGIPHPIQFALENTVEPVTGFRNQDMNSVNKIWDFFSQFVE